MKVHSKLKGSILSIYVQFVKSYPASTVQQIILTVQFGFTEICPNTRQDNMVSKDVTEE